MKKTVIISSAAIVVLAAAVYFIFLGSSTRKYEYRFDKITKGDIAAVVNATGAISAVTQVDVGTQVSGIVAKLYADFNSVVKEGQIIAQIDSTFLVQAVKDAEANLDRARAQLADAKRAVDREKVMLEKGLDPQVTYDAALTTYESNSAAMKQAQATLDRAKINLTYATIYAPIDGVVINRQANIGQTVAASFSSPTLYTIANDLHKMQVLATIDESDIGMISVGEQANFTVDAYPEQKFSGTVSQIRLAPVTVQNVVNYNVVIAVNNDELKLMPGMTANVKIQIASAADVMRVPNMALRLQPPTDLIDTTKMEGQAGQWGRNGMSGDTNHRGLQGASRGNEGGQRSGDGSGRMQMGERSGSGGGEHRAIFQKMRDSIQAAHGGKLTEEELRSEMVKIYGRMQENRQPAPVAKAPASGTTGATKFGITAMFPEYQKSLYVVQHDAGRARIWILNSKGRLEPVVVRTGVTDGRYTEISSANLKPGDQVVLGVSVIGESVAEQTRSPLTGGGGRMGGPGGFH